MVKKSALAICFLFVAVLLAISCAAPTPAPASAPAPAPAPTSVPAPAPKPNATPAPTTRAPAPVSTIDALYQAAKKEGAVTWCTQAQPLVQPLIDAFEKKYPGIKVSTFTLAFNQLPGRIITEQKAGSLTVDVATGTPTYVLPLLERDLMVGYDWTKISDVDPKAVVLDKRFVVLYDGPIVYVYNTNMVPKNEVPQKFEDLLSPKWKGRKIATTATGYPAYFLFQRWQTDPERVIGLVKRLRQQELLVGTDIRDLMNRVAAGEVPLVCGIATTLVEMQGKGAPVALCPISPTFNTPFGHYVPKDSPHPNAAKLLMAYVSSKEALPMWLAQGRGSATPCDASPMAKVLCDAGVKYMRLTTIKEANAINNFGNAVIAALGFPQ